jgi:uncharacterized membrane protein
LTYSRPKVTGWRRDLILFLDRQIFQLARHWLAVFNLLTGVYVLLPILAPVLMAQGAPQVGELIYLVYRPACHQLPERSFFLYGPRATYTLDELWAIGAIDERDDAFARQRFLGTPEIGFKIALCQRDIAMYSSLFLGGLLFGLLRRRIRSLSLLAYGLCLLPMAIDGGTQLIFARESTWFLRVTTGGLVGFATVWLLYPYLETAFADIRLQANERVHLEPVPEEWAPGEHLHPS